MTARAIVATLAVIISGAALIACAGASRGKPTAAGMDAQPGATAPHSPATQDISMAMKEIREWRMQMGLPPAPQDLTLIQFRRLPLSKAFVCTGDERPQTGTCGEVCDLATHICENAEDICRIAGDMPGNAWAEDKCTKAKASCKEAEDKCCGCDEGAITGGGTGGSEAEPEAKNRFWN